MALGSNRDYVTRDRAIKKALKKAGYEPKLWECKNCHRKQYESSTKCPRCGEERK